MRKLGEIYRNHIYGVITTLIFHIVVLIILLISQLEVNEKTRGDETILMEMAPEVKKLSEAEKVKELQQQMESFLQQKQSSGQPQSNRAVNDANKSSSRAAALASNDPFFDKAYNNEIAAAKQLVDNVNKTLAKKIPKIADIPMPEDNTEGKTREEVKQSNFKGKSNIHYYLENRYHARLPIPVYLAEGGGEVTVDIVVSRDGRVISANPRSNSQIEDLTMLAYAKQAAEKTWFNQDPSAPEKQKGTITYRFVAQ